jgi:hypothetical protein
MRGISTLLKGWGTRIALFLAIATIGPVLYGSQIALAANHNILNNSNTSLGLNYPGAGGTVKLSTGISAYNAVASQVYNGTQYYYYENGSNCLTWNSSTNIVYIASCGQYPASQSWSYASGSKLVYNAYGKQIYGTSGGCLWAPIVENGEVMQLGGGAAGCGFHDAQDQWQEPLE